MRDITHKAITLRTAKAIGVLFCSAETLKLIREDRLPKGNLFDVARAAGFLGAKATPQLLPHCHPVAIDGMKMEFEFVDPSLHLELLGAADAGRSGIVITGEARSIGRTGIEMEILTAVSVAALEIYDMLKPVDKQLEIGRIRLLEKKGGKSPCYQQKCWRSRRKMACWKQLRPLASLDRDQTITPDRASPQL